MSTLHAKSGSPTRGQSRFTGEVQQGWDGGAEDVCVEDAAAETASSECQGEVDCAWYLEHNFRWIERESVPARVDFPTPPLAEETAITFWTSLMLRRSGKPRCMRGTVPVRGKPCKLRSARLNDVHVAILQLTKGFSCCMRRNVENSRGFMLELA